jgi:hypothetical protein
LKVSTMAPLWPRKERVQFSSKRKKNPGHT